MKFLNSYNKKHQFRDMLRDRDNNLPVYIMIMSSIDLSNRTDNQWFPLGSTSQHLNEQFCVEMIWLYYLLWDWLKEVPWGSTRWFKDSLFANNND